LITFNKTCVATKNAVTKNVEGHYIPMGCAEKDGNIIISGKMFTSADPKCQGGSRDFEQAFYLSSCQMSQETPGVHYFTSCYHPKTVSAVV
jgi:hypothetical protein